MKNWVEKEHDTRAKSRGKKNLRFQMTSFLSLTISLLMFSLKSYMAEGKF